MCMFMCVCALMEIDIQSIAGRSGTCRRFISSMINSASTEEDPCHIDRESKVFVCVCLYVCICLYVCVHVRLCGCVARVRETMHRDWG